MLKHGVSNAVGGTGQDIQSASKLSGACRPTYRLTRVHSSSANDIELEKLNPKSDPSRISIVSPAFPSLRF
jgi:hypothetical protein